MTITTILISIYVISVIGLIIIYSFDLPKGIYYFTDKYFDGIDFSEQTQTEMYNNVYIALFIKIVIPILNTINLLFLLYYKIKQNL